MKKTVIIFSLFMIVNAIFTSCTKSSSTPTTYNGDIVNLGTGTMGSWIQTDVNGNPVSIGFTINEAALSALPAKDTMYMLMLPGMSGGKMGNMMMPTPFDHIEVDWSHSGDSGSAYFNHPHLDCHFFTVTSSSQMGIMMGMDSVMMDTSYIPLHCMGDSMDEVNMGTHWYDTTAQVFHGGVFDHLFSYGFYRGNMTFIEVMCAKSYLDTKSNCTGNIEQPKAFKVKGYYPVQYSVSYDANAKEYSYTLQGLVSH